MKSLRSKNPREKGIALILMAIMTFFVVPITGLAIDASVMYWIKARMQAAADGASIASARSLSTGLTLAAQESAAASRAVAYFNANFPSGFLGSSTPVVTATVTENTHTRIVTLNASLTASTYFMKVANALIASENVSNPTINITSTATRRDVNMILVLDRSGSMNNNNACATMQTSATNFINNFANNRDNIGLISFAGAVTTDFPMSTNFKGSGTTDPNSIYGAINRITCNGSTNTATGFWKGYQALAALNQPGALNLMVFMTDGQPTSLTANLPIKTNSDTRYDYNSTSSLTTVPASGCRNSAGHAYSATAAPNEPTILGSIATYTSYWPDQGATWGVNAYLGTVSGTTVNYNEFTNAAYPNGGCLYPTAGTSTSAPSSSQFGMRNDISYIPNTDAFGNATSGYRQPVARFTSGPYNGYIRPDMPSTLRYVTFNAADSAASRMRGDTATGVLVYSIGLGGNDTDPIDQTFLKRLTNTSDSPVYSSSAPTGTFLYAPTVTQLNQLFQNVASSILRIAK
jgi:Mg-chelatase subunit ChlD